MTDRYLQPGWFTRNVFNRVVAVSTAAGLSFLGSRVLQVKGRTSGQVREVPVNLLTVDGTRYLVAPRGVTQWVRNIRVSGEGGLRLGRTVERFRAVELPEAEKAPVLRAYLKRWKWEVGAFFDGVGPDSTDAELIAVGPKHPVFRVESV